MAKERRETGMSLRLGQALRFVGGFALGVLALPALAALGLAGLLAISIAFGGSQPREISASFWTWGWDVTRAGGASLLVRQDRGAVTKQRCRGACDDLVFWYEPAELVEVRDAKGACVVCRGQGLRLPFQSAKRWALGGAPLSLQEDKRR
jgi:hypothetical protein